MKNNDFSPNIISCSCLYGTFTLFMLYIKRIDKKKPTDCLVDLIYILLAAQLYYFELKNTYMAKYFYLDCDK